MQNWDGLVQLVVLAQVPVAGLAATGWVCSGRISRVRRYLLHVDRPADEPMWPPVIGVTGFDLDDCLEIVGQWFGPRSRATLIGVVEEPDLTDFVPGMFPLGGALGVTVWRGIWYPPLNLGGPESLETTNGLRERWPESGGHPHP